MQIKNKLRFSLRTLLIITAGLMLWLAKLSNDARNQAAAVKAIEAAEGHIEFKLSYDAPEWAKNIFGAEFFRQVVLVGLSKNSRSLADDQTLEQISCLTSLETLELGWSEKITDEGLRHLRGLKNLKTLYLYRTRLRGPGLKYIAELPHLQTLVLVDSHIDDSAMIFFKHMQELSTLHLGNTQITDASLPEIAKSRSIKLLTLDNTEISDVGLKALEQLSILEHLDVARTNVSLAGVTDFRKVLPRCNVSVSFELGKIPTEQPLFADGYQATAVEINSKFKELKIDGEVTDDRTRTGKPIVRFQLFSSTLSDNAVLSLMKLMPEVERLRLCRALNGDEFLKQLDAPKLDTLSILGTRITDEGLQELGKLKNLRNLELEEIKITDRGLNYLNQLTQLRRLNVRKTNVSVDGVAKLRKALPKCQIGF